MHRPKLKHANVDALSKNPVGSVANDNDFGEGIQDIIADVLGRVEELLYVRRGKETKWIGVNRKDKKSIQHDVCCFGINHRLSTSHHHLYMLDLAVGEGPSEESAPTGESIAAQDEHVQQRDMSVAIKRRRPQYFDRQQQLDLALAAQRLSELGDPDLNPTSSNDEDECEVRMGCVDIWEDADCLALLREGVLADTVDSDEGRRIRRRVTKVLFGYRCGIQSSMKFSPFMILTGRTPRLRADNFLQTLTTETDESGNVETVATQKVELIASLHSDVLINVEQAQMQQKKNYATRKGRWHDDGSQIGLDRQ
ncbi:unnamed protein product [Sphagnum jensenii]|uniref:Uncharacterized protein n=1 Tax=Sphagnum jensenii TaxID=128206 RepID=A0ABP0XD84_9BRYO